MIEFLESVIEIVGKSKENLQILQHPKRRKQPNIIIFLQAQLYIYLFDVHAHLHSILSFVFFWFDFSYSTTQPLDPVRVMIQLHSSMYHVSKSNTTFPR